MNNFHILDIIRDVEQIKRKSMLLLVFQGLGFVFIYQRRKNSVLSYYRFRTRVPVK